MEVTDLNYHKHRNLILAFAEGTAKAEDAEPLLKEAFAYPEFTVWDADELGDYLSKHFKLKPDQIEGFMTHCPIHIPEGKDKFSENTPMPKFEKDSVQVIECQNSYLEARYHLQKAKRAVSSGTVFPGNFKDQDEYYQAANQRLKVNDWFCQINKDIDMHIENADLFITEKQ